MLIHVAAFEVVDDTVQGVADGFINSVLGIAGLATGAVSDAGGAAVAKAAEDYNEWSGGIRSDQMQYRSLARELRNERCANVTMTLPMKPTRRLTVMVL